RLDLARVRDEAPRRARPRDRGRDLVLQAHGLDGKPGLALDALHAGGVDLDVGVLGVTVDRLLHARDEVAHGTALVADLGRQARVDAAAGQLAPRAHGHRAL